MEVLGLPDWEQLASSPKIVAAAALLLALFATYAAAWGLKALQFHLRIKRGLAPTPSGKGKQWLLGHAAALAWDPAGRPPWDVMDSWLDDAPIVKYRLFNRQGVVVGDAESMKRIFQTRQRVYDKDLEFTYYHFLDILGSGLVTANGALWQKQRLLIGPALRHDILDDVAVMARDAVDRLSAKLQTVRGTGRRVDIDEEFRLLTLQVIGQAVLSLPPEECDRVFPDLYLPVMEEANHRVFAPWRAWLPSPAAFRYRQCVRKLNAYLLNIIRSRWRERSSGKQPAHMDMLDRILLAMEERGEKMTPAMEQQLCYELKTFLLAGHETSAAMLTWTLYELTQHPDSLAKVKEEAVRLFGTHDERRPGKEELEGMPFTVSSLKESLRRYTIVPVVVRVNNTDDELCGRKVPAGSLVTCMLQRVHMSWSQPENWSPARFMPGGEYESFDESIRPYMFLPFIQGPRNCLGQYFSLLEARVVLALLVKRFKFRPLVRSVTRDPKVIPLYPAEGMPMLVD